MAHNPKGTKGSTESKDVKDTESKSPQGGRVDSGSLKEILQQMQQLFPLMQQLIQRVEGGVRPVQPVAAVDQSTPVVSDSVSSLRQALPAAAGVQGTLVVSDFVSRSGKQTLSAAAVPTVSAAVLAVSTASVVQTTPAVSKSVASLMDTGDAEVCQVINENIGGTSEIINVSNGSNNTSGVSLFEGDTDARIGSPIKINYIFDSVADLTNIRSITGNAEICNGFNNINGVLLNGGGTDVGIGKPININYKSETDLNMVMGENKMLDSSTSPWYNRSILLPKGQYIPSRLHDKRHRFWPYRLSLYSRVKYIQRLCITHRKQIFSGKSQKKRKKDNCSNQYKWNQRTQESFNSGNLGIISLTEISDSDSNDSSTAQSILE